MGFKIETLPFSPWNPNTHTVTVPQTAPISPLTNYSNDLSWMFRLFLGGKCKLLLVLSNIFHFPFFINAIRSTGKCLFLGLPGSSPQQSPCSFCSTAGVFLDCKNFHFLDAVQFPHLGQSPAY